MNIHIKYPLTFLALYLKTEDEARPWILLEHTGQNKGIGVLTWNSEQQKRYIQKFSKLNIYF